MLATKVVKGLEQFKGVGDLLSSLGVRSKDKARGDTPLKEDSKVFRRVWRIAGVIGQLPHVIRGSVIWVFQDASFIGAVSKAVARLATVISVSREGGRTSHPWT